MSTFKHKRHNNNNIYSTHDMLLQRSRTYSDNPTHVCTPSHSRCCPHRTQPIRHYCPHINNNGGSTGPTGLNGLLSVTYAYGLSTLLNTPTPSNTFNDFGLLCAYLETLALDTLVTIYIDGTYCNNLPIIGPGSFHLPRQVLFQGLSIAIPGYPVLNLQSETYLTGMTELSLRNLSMIFNNTITPTINVNQSLNIWLYDANIINNGTVPGISYNGSEGTIMMYGNSSIKDQSNC